MGDHQIHVFYKKHSIKFEINVLTCMYKLLQDKHMRHFLKFILIFALAAPSELLND